VYRVEGGKIFPRHLHYVYWDGNGWEKRLYAHRIDCPITKTAVQRYPDIPRIDARPDPATPRLPQAINIPANQQRLRLPQTGKAGEVPLIVYCSDPECPAAGELIDRLAARGFVNTFWYRGGVRDWFSQKIPGKHAMALAGAPPKSVTG
jgi:rhodanese-related sulfurtransferase